MSPTRHKNNCSLKEKHSTRLSFYSVSHTLFVPVGTIITRTRRRDECEDDDGIRVILQGGLDSGPRDLEVVLEAQFHTRQEGGYP